MPVKVRCKGCEKVLNAPDKLRGKTVKCPKCKSPLKVPTGKKRPAAATAQKKRRPPAPEPEEDYENDGDLFGGLDLRGAEDRKVKLCPKCATEVDPEDIECLNCGINIATGVLSAKQRKDRSRKGPDPDEYWGRLYKDSWAFTKRHWKLALQTAGMYMVLGALTICAGRTCEWCYSGYRDMLVEAIKDSNGKVELKADGIYINASKDEPVTFIVKRYYSKPKYPLWRPEYMAAWPLNNPPFIFWGFMTGVFGLALAGWMWFVGTNIVRVTLDGKKKLKELQGDFFAYISLGIKAVTWPVILWLPVFWIAIALGVTVSPIGGGIVGGALLLITVPIFAVCMVHMTQNYVYKAYLMVPMLRITLKNLAATVYWAISAAIANIGLIAAIGAVAALSMRIGPEYKNFIAKQAKPWIKGNIWGFEGEWGQFTFMELPTLFICSLLIVLPIAALSGFATMFMMRGIGLFGRYFNGELELMNESDKGQPCGFGPRYLAAIIDIFMVPLTPILVAGDRVLQMINLFTVLAIVLVLVTFEGDARDIGVPGILIMGACIMTWTYYAVQEAGYEQCTTGKNALNLIVTDMEGNRISRSVATKRLLMKIVGGIPLLGGFMMAAFSPNSQGLHDKVAKTLVVWRGESEQSRL